MSSARASTLLHLKRLAAAATVVSAGTSATSACKKEPIKAADEGGAASTDASSDLATDGGTTTAQADPDAVAPSTEDSAVFVETHPKDGKDAGNWRHPPPKPTGYAVVDPMPRPVRLPDGGFRK